MAVIAVIAHRDRRYGPNEHQPGHQVGLPPQQGVEHVAAVELPDG